MCQKSEQSRNMNCMKRDGKHSLTHTTGNYLRHSFDTTILQQTTYEQY